MEWKLEIYRAFFVAFGAFESFTNFSYFTKKNGIRLARKQHKELPENVSDRQIKAKVTAMFLFGLAFLFNGLCSYYVHAVNSLSFTVNLSLFCIYAFSESLYYKYWKTFGFFLLSTVLLIVFLL